MLFFISYSLISCELLISLNDSYKKYCFLKEYNEIFQMDRNKFFAQIRKKCTILGNLRAIIQERKRNYTNDPKFLIYFLSSNCLWYSFLYLKIAKIHFHRVLLSSIPVCKVPEFWRCKLWDTNSVSFDSGNIHNKESKKPGFTFSFEVRTKFVWSHDLLLLVPECYFA